MSAVITLPSGSGSYQPPFLIKRWPSRLGFNLSATDSLSSACRPAEARSRRSPPKPQMRGSGWGWRQGRRRWGRCGEAPACAARWPVFRNVTCRGPTWSCPLPPPPCLLDPRALYPLSHVSPKTACQSRHLPRGPWYPGPCLDRAETTCVFKESLGATLLVPATRAGSRPHQCRPCSSEPTAVAPTNLAQPWAL